MALIKVSLEEETEWALEAIRSYLLTRRFQQLPTNTRLIPSASDRQQFRSIWTGIKTSRNLRDHDWGGYEPIPPEVSGSERGKMINAFKFLVKKAQDVYENSGFEGIQEVWEIALSKLSFVTINLRSPTAAPSIFERLNARGERINVSDLVRNEIFSRVANEPALAQEIFTSNWEPFVKKFTDRAIEFEKILFPYGLTFDSNLKKADLFQSLRRLWGDTPSPREIIEQMESHTPVFFALSVGESDQFIDQEFNLVLHDLHFMGAPSSIYPFVFSLYESVRNESVRSQTAVDCLRIIETFLFRRALLGLEPTGLHAVFKGLWGECDRSDLTAAKVSLAISRRTTVPWPNDIEFRDSIINKDLYRRRVCKYALFQYEKAQVAESPSDDFEVEHIYPQNPSADWNIPQDEDSEKMKNVWGNLVPITRNMNEDNSNYPYDEKVESYSNSMFSSTRNIPEQYQEWTIDSIRLRGETISEWALERWPHNRV
tara:strand:- start:3618 stop:5072 length:1455 start_codon:yes stop_codon:yes gene_type:complete